MTKIVAALLLTLAIPAQAFFDIGRGRVEAEQPQQITQFVSGWFSWKNPAMFHRTNGRVYLEGLVRLYPTQQFGGVAFFLPPGYRPEYDQRFAVDTGNGFGTVTVRMTGEVFISTESSMWVSLAGVSFRASH